MFKRKQVALIDPIDELLKINPWRKDAEQRADMTVSCQDSEIIPKVPGAGKVSTIDGKKVQLMHNGLQVLAGGYHGEWMQKIISRLRGHHEPQEERLFHEVTKRLDGKPTIIELGSFWSYYSLWLINSFKDGRAIACEPDSQNRQVGISNAAINKLSDRITFIDSAAGSNDGKTVEIKLDSDQEKTIKVKVRSVDSLIKEHKLKRLDILHMDVQGVELDALTGALESMKAGKIRFVFVSTHHYLYSHDPLTHQKCKQLLIEQGAHIVASHTVLESFSGDGLIVASFDKRDKDFNVDISLNHSDDSLFRPYEEDVALMIGITHNAIRNKK